MIESTLFTPSLFEKTFMKALNEDSFAEMSAGWKSSGVQNEEVD